ncbi:MAG: ATP-binding cassette domain-containing protein [Fidelibacterota bacterium]
MTELAFSIKFPKFETPTVDLVLRPGVTVIYGESGVGKSQFCRRIVVGRQERMNTNFVVQNRLSPANPMLVMQDPDDQIVAPSIFSEMAFNLENLGWSSRHIGEEVQRWVTLFDIHWDLHRHPSTLSGGERELLNLVTALSVSPDFLVIDDGLAFLSDGNKKKVARILEEYCERKSAVVVWVTSDLSDVRFGTQAWELRLDCLSSDIVSSELSSHDNQPVRGSAYVVASNLTFSYGEVSGPLFHHQSFTAGPFRALALLGDNGTGKSTLGRLLKGIIRPQTGNIQTTLENGTAPRTGFLPQSPERLFGGRTFHEVLDELVHHSLFRETDKPSLESTLEGFRISWDLVSSRSIHDLKLSVVRVVLTVMMSLANYDVLILDEPLFSLGEN